MTRQSLENQIKSLRNIKTNFENLLLNVFGIKSISTNTTIEIIRARKPKGKFLEFRKDGGFTAVDNSDGDAWTEDFETIEEAFRYLQGEDLDDIQQNKNYKGD
ncbi:hypothetical protein [Clostridium felsineum]|uniref:Uncharacterized protein n=1 Tax=Clostridium felsineum TaxID=36839 RepID=A0A1S8LWR4_9CLOT|nr:hypothetical protein [Clostridium felsineum]URZ05922.1 hypothetical protein CLROS_012540 [Clostridium felsineum]URZ10959.1 hypothetical protein CROST_016750 [Clostridium felsineum]